MSNYLTELPEDIQQKIWKHVYTETVIEEYKDEVDRKSTCDYNPYTCLPRYRSIRDNKQRCNCWFNPITEEFYEEKILFGMGLVMWLLERFELDECNFSDEDDYEYWEAIRWFFSGECYAYDSQSFYTIDQYYCKVEDNFDPDDYDLEDFRETIERFEKYNEGDSFDRSRYLPYIPY